MCSERLLSRLRLRTIGRKKTRKPFDEVLKKALSSLDDDVKLNLCEARAAIEAQAKDVSRLVSNWRKHQTETRLGELVEGIHLLWRINGLRNLLDSIPHDRMEPSCRDSLWNMITKVARYREAARILYRLARKFPVVRQATVVPVSLPKDAFARVPRNCYTPSLKATLARVDIENDMPRNTGKLFHSLGFQFGRAEHVFATQMRQILEEAKIHAEVQIEWHCRIIAPKRPPRVICSSKDACFLCYNLVVTSGKRHIPKSHGRLYPGWRLPVGVGSSKRARQFNNLLEAEIRDSIKGILALRKKAVYPDPLESTILTLERSESTLPSFSTSHTTGGKLMGVASDRTAQCVGLSSFDGDEQSAPATTPRQPHSVGHVEAEWAGVNHADELTCNFFPLHSTTERSISHATSNPCFARHVMSEDQPCIGIIEHNHTNTLYKAGSLTLQIEYSAGSSDADRREPRKLNYKAECLSAGDAERARTQGQFPIIDAEKADYTWSYPITESRLFYIACRGSIFKIELDGVMA